ncbi:MAG: diguanylate cyclase [Candidatus Omnitrophica bacterium]|nr:diguanylate cyclase [Candidatus Omnitrophota bacterium]
MMKVRVFFLGVCFLKVYNNNMEEPLKMLIVTDDKKLSSVLEFCFDGWGYEVFFEADIYPEMNRIVKISPDVIVVDVNSGVDTRLEFCNSLKEDFSTAYIPVIILINKKHLRQQLLDLRHGVDDYLIKPPDPLELRIRIEMSIKRSKQSFYASPLTGLPGGIVIEDMLKKRIESGIPFVAGQVDIDNFKSFNDKYGYLKGDRVIMQTAYMLTTSVRNLGNKNDFVGHIGGDDFMIVTTPDKYNAVCQNFICMFDTITPFHYSREDRAKGHIVVKDRTDTVRKLPLMSVTVALVMKNCDQRINTLIELNDIMAEVKQYLKKIPGSKYLADRRMVKKDDHLQVQVFNNDESLLKNYKPLGQILIERNVVTAEQLDKALKIHWKKGVMLGEALKELGMLTDDKLTEALMQQEESLGGGTSSPVETIA